MGKNVGIITQARLGSTRLPSKVLLSIEGKTLLDYHYERLCRSGLPVIIATTTKKEDDLIEAICKQKNIAFSRGSENDVLARFVECARLYQLDIIVRVTSDCPLIDGDIISQAVLDYKTFNDDRVYYSNTIDRTYPRGLDVEIFSRVLLEEANAKATLSSDREHVTPFMWNNRTEDVIVRQFKASKDTSEFRITVDTSEDFKLIEKLIVDYNAESLTGDEIVLILGRHPELKAINAHIEQKKV